MDENLAKLKKFFDTDMNLKKEMVSIAPPDPSIIVDDMMFADCLYKTKEMLPHMVEEMKEAALDIFGQGSGVHAKAKILGKQVSDYFNMSKLDIDHLRYFYETAISYMDPKLMDKIKDECCGYSTGFTTCYNDAKTMNEMLHFMHSYVMNNDGIYKSIPAIASVKNDYDYEITLRGERNPLFEQLFSMFPKDLDVGWTDMVIVDENRMIMMVRDRGHALTIDITVSGQNVKIEYFIPKICNVDMVNALPGVKKVQDTTIGTTGEIQTDVNNLPNTLFDFISRVPMDSDIVNDYSISVA